MDTEPEEGYIYSCDVKTSSVIYPVDESSCRSTEEGQRASIENLAFLWARFVVSLARRSLSSIYTASNIRYLSCILLLKITWTRCDI